MTDVRTVLAARYAVRVYPDIVRVQAAVADYFGVNRAELFKPCRRRSVARPRQIAMWIVRQCGRYSLPEIGRAFGGRDHTTILHGVRLVNAMMQADAEFAGLVGRVWAHVDTNQPQAVETKTGMAPLARGHLLVVRRTGDCRNARKGPRSPLLANGRSPVKGELCPSSGAS